MRRYISIWIMLIICQPPLSHTLRCTDPRKTNTHTPNPKVDQSWNDVMTVAARNTSTTIIGDETILVGRITMIVLIHNMISFLFLYRVLFFYRTLQLFLFLYILYMILFLYFTLFLFLYSILLFLVPLFLFLWMILLFYMTFILVLLFDHVLI